MLRPCFIVACLPLLLAAPGAHGQTTAAPSPPPEVQDASEPTSDVRYSYVHTARSQGEGHTSLGAGLTLAYFIPLVELHVVHGIIDRLDYRLRLQTVGIANILETGFQGTVYQSPTMALALRAEVTAYGQALDFGFDMEEGIALAATPGIAFSFNALTLKRPTRVETTFAVDWVAFFLMGATPWWSEEFEVNTGNFFHALRPSLSVEFAINDQVGFYLRWEVWIPMPLDSELETETPLFFFAFGPNF